jgi:hypothetical protein
VTPPSTPTEPAAPPPVEPPPAAVAPPTDASIPSWRLREEADRARAAEQRAQVLEERLNQVATHLRQQEKKPDFFEDPNKASQDLIMRAMQPYAEETRRTLMYMGKMIANTAHGADKVEAAETAFLKARAEQALDPADYERVVQSPNRYDAVVQWHKRQSVLSSVGDDPNAWFDRQLEAKMADPKFQASLLERVRTGAAGRPGITSLPPSLSKSTAAAGNREDVGDMSDSSLFAFARK